MSNYVVAHGAAYSVSNAAHKLQERVNRYLKEGYVLYGNMTACIVKGKTKDYHCLYQALIKSTHRSRSVMLKCGELSSS